MPNATQTTAGLKAKPSQQTASEPAVFGEYLLLRKLTRGPENTFLAASERRRSYHELCLLRRFPSGNVSVNALKDLQRSPFPGLPEIVDVGQVNEDQFLVFSYNGGRDLAWFLEHCQRHHAPIPLGIVLHLMKEVAGFLQTAQERSLLPQVLRAQDFFLTYDGKLSYLDIFPGREPSEEHQSASYSIKDPRGLVPFCGALVHEMLSGAKTLPTLPAVTSADEKIRIAEVPDSMAPFIFRALSRDEQRRFPTIEALNQDLQGLSGRLAATFNITRLLDFLQAHLDSEVTADQRDASSIVGRDLAGLYRALTPNSSGAVEPSSPKTINITTGSFGSGAIGSQLGAETPPNPQALVGQQIGGRYRIKSLLGIGGMGWVYKAEHIEIGKQLALKVLHRNLCSNPEVVTRFRREARSASMIGHPNIIEVTDFGSMPDGSVYCVMELLDGVDLAKILSDEHRVAERRVVNISIQMCKALEAAHNAGIIHRDMKPANVVLIEREGQKDFVKILDFGIAKMTGLDEQQTSLTRPGMTMGTPQYMAPEQAAGKPLDARADIYAVGAIMYELIVGQPPFTGLSVMEVLTRKLTQPPPPFSARNVKDAHPGLEALVLRCLDRKADNRPQHCGEVAQLLQAILDTLDDPEARKRKPAGALHSAPSEAELAAVQPPKSKGWAIPFFGGVAALAAAGIVSWQLGILPTTRAPNLDVLVAPITQSSPTSEMASSQNSSQPNSMTAQTAPASLPAEDAERIALVATTNAFITAGSLISPPEDCAYLNLKKALERFPEDAAVQQLKASFIEALLKETEELVKKHRIKSAEEALAVLEEFAVDPALLEPYREGIKRYNDAVTAAAGQREDRKDDAINAVKEGDDALRKGSVAEAKKSYEKALRLLPKYNPATLGLAKVAFQQGKYADAANKAKEVLRTSPSNVDALVLLGDARFRSYSYQAALDAYKKALTISPGSTAAKKGEQAAKKALNLE